MKGFEQLTVLQHELYERVRAELEAKPWFCGVSLDHLPSDVDIQHYGMERAVELMVLDTQMWDDPDFFSPADIARVHSAVHELFP